MDNDFVNFDSIQFRWELVNAFNKLLPIKRRPRKLIRSGYAKSDAIKIERKNECIAYIMGFANNDYALARNNGLLHAYRIVVGGDDRLNYSDIVIIYFSVQVENKGSGKAIYPLYIQSALQNIYYVWIP